MNRIVMMCLCVTALAGCATVNHNPEANPRDGDCEGGKCDDARGKSGPGLCAAIRGNGQLIGAHFGSLARITEHYGLIDAAAGGSSASITIFLTESMQMNPGLSRCGDESCSETEVRARAALMLKSVQGYLEALGHTEEGAALLGLAPLAQRIQAEGLMAVAESDPDAAVAQLLSLLESNDLRSLINPELIGLLQQSPNPEYHVQDVVAAIQSFGAFSTEDANMAVRPGLINFQAFAQMLGRIGNFYAGYGPHDADAQEAFFDACASSTAGMTWRELSSAPAGDSTCGAMFTQLMLDYRSELVANESMFPSRVDDHVGRRLPALISTSVLSGRAHETATQARAQYFAAETPELEFSFDDISFGYWGRDQDLMRAEEGLQAQDDEKSRRFMSLGEATWREVLALSPAEPGLARFLEFGDGLTSAGGWSDLHPVQVLRATGCENVVYVTRSDEESGFAQGVARMLGMSEQQQDNLYNLGNADSAFSRAVADANAVWCTDWNAYGVTEMDALISEAYHAEMVSADPFFIAGDSAYDAVASTDRVGCAR